MASQKTRFPQKDAFSVPLHVGHPLQHFVLNLLDILGVDVAVQLVNL